MRGSKVLLEIIAASLDDALLAEEGGADRLEVCSALALGGLTPSLGTVRRIKAEMGIPIVCMVRPREGGMAYSEGEYSAMLDDAALLLEEGADGLVFGFLTPAAEVDLPRCRKFLKLVSGAGREVQTVFHRAFDVVEDADRALEELVDLGIQRILTSGRRATAEEGSDEIRRLLELADGRIEILPGGGIQKDSVADLVRATGVDQVHLYVTRAEEDPSASQNPEIYFGAHVPTSETKYQIVDREEVRAIRTMLG